MGHRELLITAFTALAVAGGGVALGQSTSEGDREGRTRGERWLCNGPAPRTALERRVLQKAEEQMRKAEANVPEGWTVGECNSGIATAR